MTRFLLMVLGILLLNATIDAANILAVFPFPGKSHFGAYARYLEELSRRGHHITVVSAFPRETPMANYTDIPVQNTLLPKDGKHFNVFEIREHHFISIMLFKTKVCSESCEKFLQEPNMQELIHSKDKQYDLILMEQFFSECSYGLLHKFKAPVIQISPNTLIPWEGNFVGNPSTVSYIPELTMEEEKMGFEGRMINFLRWSFLFFFRKFYIIPSMERIMRKYFTDPSLPSIEELETNAAFLFLHSHPVLNYPRPLTPNTVEVGGLHIKESRNQLPQDIQKFMDDARHGVIYFSLGSHVRSADMPKQMRSDILEVFSKLKQKVLWKWEADSLPGQPSNVRLGTWLPQHDILAHTNLKLFITHGGLMSIQEATYFGVPVIAVPIVSDQKLNALNAQSSGYALLLDIQNITEASMSWAIEEVLGNPRYRENAKHVSRVFRDQPQTPMERAIFWTEYAIRHKGATHMRSAALQLNFFQYHLLDVIAVLCCVGLLAIVLVFLAMRAIFRRCCSRPTKKSVPKSKKRN